MSNSSTDYRSQGFVIPEALSRGGPPSGRGMDPPTSGLELLSYLIRLLSLDSLKDVSMLDVGCGHRFAQAILANDVPVARYTGLDVFNDLMAYLRTQVTDPRFEFLTWNAYNRLYNPDGEPLSLSSTLPVAAHAYDLVTLFSVFTHLDPRDADCLLAVLKHCIRQDGRLAFSCFINENISGFDDTRPDKPLARAMYTSGLMEHLIMRNGWKVVDFRQPVRSPNDYWLVQHHYVCAPA